MTTSILVTKQDEPAQQISVDGLAASAEQYGQWGWTLVSTGDRLLLAVDHLVSAVELPVAIAGEVQHFLAVRMLAGPVIVLPGKPGRWLLLTESADDAAPINSTLLRARNSSVHTSGTLVPLPPSRM